MLNLFRSRPKKFAIIASLVLVVVALIMGAVNSSKSYPNRTKAEIDLLVRKGDTPAKVEEALGPPDSKDERLWHYSNARRSYRSGTSYVPASIGVGFNDSGHVELVLKGPVP